MKRSLILTLALSLAAVLVSLPSAGAQTTTQPTTPTIVRGTPVQVTASTTPTRDRTRPYRFTTRGRIIPPPQYCTPGRNPGPLGAENCVPVLCPPGVTDPRYCIFPGRGVICSGSIQVKIQKRSTTISSRNRSVRPDCSYTSSVTFRLLLPTRRGLLNVKARFAGNAVLNPRSSVRDTVRAG